MYPPEPAKHINKTKICFLTFNSSVFRPLLSSAHRKKIQTNKEINKNVTYCLKKEIKTPLPRYYKTFFFFKTNGRDG